MGMRITTSMMMNTYRFNLQNSTGTLNSARNKVLSQRKFDSYAEDPASATQAWRLRRAMSSNFDYQANNLDTTSRFNIAWTTMGVVNRDLADLDGRFSSIRGENGAIGSGRQPLGQVLKESAETIIQAMNSAKYGDHYVFSGDDEMNPPFTWSADMSILYYRGVNVGAGAVERPVKPDWVNSELNEDGLPSKMPASSTDPWEQAWIDYYNKKDEKPGWADSPMVPAQMPETGADDWEQAWIDYFEGGAEGTAPPVSKPMWADSMPDENGIPSEMPDEDAEGLTDWDQEWMDYYKEVAAGNEDAEPPKYGLPDWAQSGLVPAEMPESSTDKWEQEWIDYYNDQASVSPKGLEKPTYYAEPEEVPAWTKLGVGADAMPENATAWDQVWADYLNNGGAEPTLDPSKLEPGKWGEPDQFGVPANVNDILSDPYATGSDIAWAKYFLDQGDAKKLELLAKEEQFVDLGMGLKENADGNLINGTAFNRSLPGIEMLGYGVDEDGDPKNIVLIMKRLGELFSASDPNSGEWAHEGDEEEAMRLMDKLTAAHNLVTEKYSEVDTRGQFLQNNQEVLETQGFYLQEERANLELEDPANAIMEFTWDYYCYSAALKVGTQLLSQSLIDYMG